MRARDSKSGWGTHEIVLGMRWGLLCRLLLRRLWALLGRSLRLRDGVGRRLRGEGETKEQLAVYGEIVR